MKTPCYISNNIGTNATGFVFSLRITYVINQYRFFIEHMLETVAQHIGQTDLNILELLSKVLAPATCWRGLDGIFDRQHWNHMGNDTCRILLVDDEPSVLRLTERIIARLGYNVISQSSALEALELFRDLPNQFDLVITDYRMPEMNGDELSREILKINPDVPVIMCSGYSSEFGSNDARKLGVKRFIRKPLMKKDFASLIEDALYDK